MSIFSKLGKGISHVAGNVKNAVVKGVKDEGHFIGSVADNKYTKMATAAALAATGAGAPLSAAILASEGLVGGGLKKGGNIGQALMGGVRGGVEGGATALASQGVRDFLGRNGTPGAVDGGDGGYDVNGEPLTNGGGGSNSGGSSWLGRLGGAVKSGAQGIGNAAKGALSTNGQFDWGKLAKAGLAGTALYGQHQATNAANAYYTKTSGQRDGALDLLQKQYADNAGLRKATADKLTSMMGQKSAYGNYN